MGVDQLSTSHDVARLGFGRTFTAHMASARFAGGEWSPVVIGDHRELALGPAAMVFHYGQAVFEGLKAFRQPDGSVALFRPADNAARFDNSARRLAMPALPPGFFVDACARLVATDEASVPSAPGQSLYLRPLLVATERCIGVKPSSEYLFVVIASPVDSYFAGGVRPLRVRAAPDQVRAAPGGTGAAKCAGNYAASLLAKEDATAAGFDEVVWLDALERRWIEELSSMNVVFVSGSRSGRPTLVTPPISGTILDGVTRRSILVLAGCAGYDVVERPVGIDEVLDGGFDEGFGCGTAAIVAPIGEVAYGTNRCVLGDGEAGTHTMALRDALTSLQEGRAEDPFGWRTPVRESPAGIR